MAIDKLNSLQFLFFRSDYFQEFGDRDGVYVDRVPFELRQRLLRWTWPTTERDQYFFQHEGRDVITREGWEAFVRWVGDAMDRQLGAEDNDPQEAETIKQKSALHYADQMIDLLDVPPVAQRQAPSDSAVLHAVYTLADYPVLASIAAKRTQARKLDGRACLHLYKSALGEIDWMTITPQEKEFMQRLGFV